VRSVGSLTCPRSISLVKHLLHDERVSERHPSCVTGKDNKPKEVLCTSKHRVRRPGVFEGRSGHHAGEPCFDYPEHLLEYSSSAELTLLHLHPQGKSSKTQVHKSIPVLTSLGPLHSLNLLLSPAVPNRPSGSTRPP